MKEVENCLLTISYFCLEMKKMPLKESILGNFFCSHSLSPVP